MKFMACLAFTHGQFMVVSLVSLIRPVFIFFMHATSEKEQFFSVWMYERLRYKMRWKIAAVYKYVSIHAICFYFYS